MVSPKGRVSSVFSSFAMSGNIFKLSSEETVSVEIVLLFVTSGPV